MTEAKTEAAPARRANAWLVVPLAWLVPGLGHALLKSWGRAAVFFLAVGALAVAGILLRGHIFTPESRDPFEMLGYLADLGTGAYYFLARTVDNGGPDVSRAAGDYGTRFFATAGVLNFLCVLDAYEIAKGRRN
jgi:hypothetical protein